MTDELAKLMWKTYWLSGGDDQSGPGGDDTNVAPWTAVARECLRQMEWARHIAILSEDPARLTIDATGLAPDDWQPK